jgi:hypothetical protein
MADSELDHHRLIARVPGEARVHPLGLPCALTTSISDGAIVAALIEDP